MFHSARIQLTAWYLLIIMAVSVTFSLVIYQMVSHEVDRFARAQRMRLERRLREDLLFTFPPVPDPEPELVNEAKQHVIEALLLVNGSILALAGWFGYILAGRTLRPIRNMVEEQNRFISDASHELRTPLTSLKSTMELSLRDKKLSIRDARLLIAESIEEVDRLQALSDGLLTMTQYQTNGNISTDPIVVKELLAQAKNNIEPIARKKGVTIISHADEFSILCDTVGMTEVLTILLDNAIKYSHPDSEVSVTAVKKDGHAEITVRDPGIGISRSDIPHIFDRFWRADSARSKMSGEGHGLGLSIAKRIVDAHHGKILVTSSEGKGSSFTVRIPVSFSRNSGEQSILKKKL